MPTTLDWREIAIRLAFTVVAGIAIGFNRSERGRPAGLRTNVLVCLAASIAMIQANLLINTTGKTPNSFVSLDLMRLPLGILSGMGFIGAGAIVRKGDLVVGITTAATLWFVTVIGLCFGGGLIVLGLVALALGLAVLWGLKWIERHTNRDRRAYLIVVAGADGPTEAEIKTGIVESGYRIVSWAITYAGRHTAYRRFRCEVEWSGTPIDVEKPGFVDRLASHPGVRRLDWDPQ
jgi:putative Mg2+ transporter-C (MgtC) family protein